MSFTILFHPDAVQDIASLPPAMKKRLKKAIEERLMTEPTLYGKPLRATLKGYWKLRIGDYRVVFGIQGADLFIYAVCHHREVYQLITGRIS